MRSLYRSAITLTALFVLSGCATFKVEDISGIKSMLENKLEAEYWASRVKAEYTGSNKDKIMELYEKAYLANNKFISTVQFDIKAKDTLKVSKDDYVKNEAGLMSAEFIKKAKELLPLVIEKGGKGKGLIIEIPIGIEVAQFINQIINNLIEQNNRKIEEARKRVYEELEKSKWKEWKELK